MLPPKPSQFIEEVSPEPDQPQHFGALRGLNPTKDIIIDDTAATAELSRAGHATQADAARHSTRLLRAGNGSSRPGYDMKFHPMDAVTRPNSAATLRHRSRLGSFYPDGMRYEVEDEDSDNQDAESSLSSATDDEDDESGSDTEQEGVLSSTSPGCRVDSTPRSSDPRATRHSLRAEAQKPVNYNRKHHPQDFDLPGYRHKARAALLVAGPDWAFRQKRKRRAGELEPDEDESEADEGQDGDAAPEPRRARKVLRSLDSGARRSVKKSTDSRKRGKAKAAKVRSTQTSHVDSSDGGTPVFLEAFDVSDNDEDVSHGQDHEEIIEISSGTLRDSSETLDDGSLNSSFRESAESGQLTIIKPYCAVQHRQEHESNDLEDSNGSCGTSRHHSSTSTSASQHQQNTHLDGSKDSNAKSEFAEQMAITEPLSAPRSACSPGPTDDLINLLTPLTQV